MKTEAMYVSSIALVGRSINDSVALYVKDYRYRGGILNPSWTLPVVAKMK
jgi:hypothetical protein